MKTQLGSSKMETILKGTATHKHIQTEARIGVWQSVRLVQFVCSLSSPMTEGLSLSRSISHVCRNPALEVLVLHCRTGNGLLAPLPLRPLFSLIKATRIAVITRSSHTFHCGHYVFVTQCTFKNNNKKITHYGLVNFP